MPDIELDRIDRKIIKLLQGNSQITNLELADAVAVSPPTCLRRVRRLREAGVITRDVAIVDPGKLGGHIQLIVSVELKGDDRVLMDAFEKTIHAQDCVMQCYLVTGSTDYVLVLCVRSMTEFEEFARTALYASPLVRRFITHTVISRVKYETRIPIDD
ncbi:Lrp/AsnC family transcriptional regulator [Azospirillum sp. B510]|uniref:Lrp/AsnC family transcriptional regulator n=1 Tax=Azospirillum sp. (strain B510) TaxID=137722 RepID=UPI0002FBB46E|nr:Lrp/AsnC family transcriptional regulator [Azospirillum sp. B510]